MNIIGNLLLVIATFLFLGILSLVFGKDPRGSSDGLMGYGWGMIILNLGFAVIMILVSLIIGFKGGFDWVAKTTSSRFWMVTVGLLGAVITAGLSGLFKFENGPVPMVIRSLSSFGPILIPVVLIGAGFILMNAGLKSSVPMPIYKWPLIFVSLIGIAGVVSGLVGEISMRQRNRAARVQANIAFDQSNHNRMLSEIDSCDVSKNLVFILVYTGDNQDKEIKERAVAKVKTHPQWQQELIRLLQTDWAPEPLQFLAFNQVDDPKLFLEPVKEGILIQAKLIRERIRRCSHPSHFYPGIFMWETERVLLTADRFSGKGVDYLPAIQEVRAALDEPSEFDKPEFTCTKYLDDWIKKHSK
jgi:hypothetical protein